MSPMNIYNDVDSESSAFVIKPKSERDDILKTLRDTVIKKNNIIKQKNLVSENGGSSSHIIKDKKLVLIIQQIQCLTKIKLNSSQKILILKLVHMLLLHTVIVGIQAR